MKISPKINFLIKAILAGIIGGKATTYYYWGFASDTNPGRLLEHFQEFLGFVLVFWLVFGNNLKIKNWLLAGIVGSAVYALISVYLKLPPYPVHYKLSMSTITLLEWVASHVLVAILGATPQWIVMRKKSSKAILWVVAIALGYGLFAVNSYAGIAFSTYLFDGNIGEMPSWLYIWAVKYSGFSATGSLGYLIRYGVFGLLLGFALFNIIEHMNTEHSELAAVTDKAS